MVAAGLLAKKAVERGLHSQAVGQDEPRARLEGRHRLPATRPGSRATSTQLGFNTRRLRLHDLHRQLRPAARRDRRRRSTTTTWSSPPCSRGNRNFEGRINPEVRANYLASPPLVVAYALAGTHRHRPRTPSRSAPASDGKPVYLRDIWPTPGGGQRRRSPRRVALGDVPRSSTATSSRATSTGSSLDVPDGRPVRLGPGLDLRPAAAVLRRTCRPQPAPVERHPRRARAGGARRQHHDRPHLAGRLDQEGQPGRQVPDRARRRRQADFNSYGARRGNHEVMVRGTFANVRLRNQLAPGTEGGVTRHLPDGEQHVDLRRLRCSTRPRACRSVILAGKEYGSGSSRDWAAKGPLLLGVARRHRRELRAHPPQQPGRHGRPAAAVPGRRERGQPRPDRRGGLRHRGPGRGGREAASRQGAR